MQRKKQAGNDRQGVGRQWRGSRDAGEDRDVARASEEEPGVALGGGVLVRISYRSWES